MAALLASLRWGKPLVVVSGLPRSGTSMMMRMLHAGGMEVMSDAARAPDIDNPHGYFELARVMDLEKEQDKSYLRAGRGKAIKVISFLLKDLPGDNRYKVVFMRRDLDEVLASQNKMIERRGADDPTDEAGLRASYLGDIARARVLARRRPNFEMLEVQYHQALADPRAVATEVQRFVGLPLDVAAMAEAVDPSLYRNRRQ